MSKIKSVEFAQEVSNLENDFVEVIVRDIRHIWLWL